MSSRQRLSIEEFATASSKQAATGARGRTGPEAENRFPLKQSTFEVDPTLLDEAKRKLRQAKRERVRGQKSFLNVNLDRQTKRRLKLASFNAETSMQAIVEAAIVKYLDDMNG